MTTEFAFAPLDYVTIVVYGLDYRGRVQQCLLRPLGAKLYNVEYAKDGEIKCSDFREDEIAARD